jgi:hypothetical protein
MKPSKYVKLCTVRTKAKHILVKAISLYNNTCNKLDEYHETSETTTANPD